jgi:hypothetical protein
MPQYPSQVTYKGYFYNSKKMNGADDRVYSATDMRKPYDAIFTDGVKPDADGTAGTNLKVSAVSGMTICVEKGYAKLGGAPFENTEKYNIVLDSATGSVRYDCVIIRNDDSEAVRAPSIYIKSLSTVPTLENLEREDAYEICVGYVVVPAYATSISESDIVDTRQHGLLCKLMTGVGATVVRTYRNTYSTKNANEQSIAIGIEQFDKGKDELIVAVEGRVFTLGSDYTVTSNTHISLTTALPVIGTKVEFTVHKNVNSTTSGDVAGEVGTLIQDVADLKKTIEHHYYCNGVNDNIALGDLVRNALDGSGYRSTKIIVHGTFGANEPALGDGGATTPYCWFNFYASSPTRRVIIDFSDCTQIVTPITDGYNVIFYGNYFHLIGVNYPVNSTSPTSEIRVFSAPNNTIVCDDCRFWVTGYKNSIIALNGTFRNCRGSVTNSIGDSFCFTPQSAGITRLEGGEYYAYTADSSGKSAVIGQKTIFPVSILYGVSVPTAQRSGYSQTHSIYQTDGYVNCTDLMTLLPMDVVTGQSNIRGTIPFDKPNVT